MTIKLCISLLTLLATHIVMTFAYHGQTNSIIFYSNLYNNNLEIQYPFLIHFLFISHFILATSYFLLLKPNFSQTDYKRLFVATILGFGAYGTYSNLNSSFGKNVFALVRYMMGYFHIFVDDLKIFFRLKTVPEKPYFITALIIFLLILITGCLTSLLTNFSNNLRFALVVPLLFTISYIYFYKKNKDFYLLFIIIFFSIPIFATNNSISFEKIGVFYFCYHVIQCYFFYPINLFFQEKGSRLRRCTNFFIIVFLIHLGYLTTGYLGVHLDKLQMLSDSGFIESIFSKYHSVNFENILDFPFVMLFDVSAYKFWGVFHISHSFFYDKSRLYSLILKG